MVAAPDTALAPMQAQRGPQHPPGVALGAASRGLQLCQLAATEFCFASPPAQLQHHMTQGTSLHANVSKTSFIMLPCSYQPPFGLQHLQDVP